MGDAPGSRPRHSFVSFAIGDGAPLALIGGPLGHRRSEATAMMPVRPTIRRNLGRIEGPTVAICGDILHSRVARSNILLLGKLAALA